MAKFNRTFELSIEDMDLIEEALRHKQKALNGEADVPATWVDRKDDLMRHTHEVLGRLHNQKTFYRPKSKVYVGG